MPKSTRLIFNTGNSLGCGGWSFCRWLRPRIRFWQRRRPQSTPNNGLPGVSFHSHAPGDTFANKMIVANQISDNRADLFDTATPGPTGININSGFGFSPITGTLIAENVIDHEVDHVALNTPAQVNVHLNNFLDDPVGVDNLGPGSADATENWWACPAATY